MKRAAAIFAAVFMVCLLTSQAHAASIYPVSEEVYTYGPFDELRIDKIYELTRFDDPTDIPTGDFDRGGYHYTLLDIVKTEQRETDANGNIVSTSHMAEIYTVTFVCQGKAMTSSMASGVPNGVNQADEVGISDLCLLVVLSAVSVGLLCCVIRTTGRRTVVKTELNEGVGH